MSKPHKVVRELLEANKLGFITDQELRVARTELMMMAKPSGYRSYTKYDRNAHDLSDMFQWDRTAVGAQFWEKIDEKIWQSKTSRERGLDP